MSFAGLMLWDVKLNAPNDRAAARADVAEAWCVVFDCDVFESMLGWRLICKALARAFSWVRTNLARFYQGDDAWSAHTSYRHQNRSTHLDEELAIFSV